MKEATCRGSIGINRVLDPELHAGILLGLLILFGASGCGQEGAIEPGPSAEASASSSSDELSASSGTAADHLALRAENNSTQVGIQSKIDAILAASPGAQQISESEVSWHDGTVVLSFPSSAAPQATFPYQCPKGWYCFYQHENFGGRMLKFSACSSSGETQSLADYGFAKQTTSWVNNNRNRTLVDVYDQSGNLLWWETTGRSSSNVGAADNDKAYYFTCSMY